LATATKRRGSFILRIVLTLFALWMIVYLGGLIKDFTSMKSELEAATARRDELALDVAEKSKLLETGNDVDFIERAAREKLGFVYADEHVYIDISGD
jgi:cell division protein FtsB